MKKIIFAFCGLAFISAINAGPIVNVEYIHSAIRQRWDITVPYNAELVDPGVAANMKYLLTTIDVANEMLNSTPITNYGDGEFATTVAADTVATNTAIEKLISINYPFIITTTDNTTTFSFDISAAGTFYVDCGADATEPYQPIIKDDTTVKTITCNWSDAGEHTVRIGGLANGYSTNEKTAAISFASNTNLASIDGSLGAIFPTLADGSQPRFRSLFNGCSNLSGTIPENLFEDINGAPITFMFSSAFRNCPKLTGTIPAGLFANISGTPASNMFNSTFYGCSSLTGLAARNGTGEFLHDIWPSASYGRNAYTGTNIEGLAYITTNWGGGGQTCAAGTYFNDTKTECLTCEAGYYCLGGTEKPIECSLGYTSDPGSSECYYTITVDSNNDDNIVETIKCNTDGCLLPPVTTTKSGFVASGKYCSMPSGGGVCYNANERHDDLVNGMLLYVDYKPVYSITLVNDVSDEFKEAPLPQPASFWLMYGTKWCADSECTVELTKLSDIPEFAGYDFAGVRTNAVAWAGTTANDIVDANGNFITDTAALTTTEANANATVQWNRGTTYCEPGYYYAGHSALSPCARCVQSGITKGKYCPGGEFNTDYASVYYGIEECPGGGTTSESEATLADCYKTETQSDVGNAKRLVTCHIDENNEYTKDCVSSGIVACNPGYYLANSGDTECSPVGYGYYSIRETERQQCTYDRINGRTPTTETETASALSECYVTNDSGDKCYYVSAYSKYYCY